MVFEKCKEELFWEIKKRKTSFSGVLTLYVSERGRMEGENLIWSSQQLGPPGPLGELLSKASHRLFLPTPESNPHPPASSKKHSHLINHPLDPCCLCWCLERNINTPMSCLYSCPLKWEFCPLRRGRIQMGKSKLCDRCSKALLPLVALGHGVTPV